MLLILVFLLGFLGLAYSIYPFVVIDQLTIWQAASSPEALEVDPVGVCISVPAIAGYTVFSTASFAARPASCTTPEGIAMQTPQTSGAFIRPERFSPDEWQARVQLAAAYRIFDHLGWTELIYNHISLRVPGEAGTI